MKIAIYSEMLSLHQIYLTDEIYKICGDDFRFFELRQNMDPTKSSFRKITDPPYLIKVWESRQKRDMAFAWALTADVARFASTDSARPFLSVRLKQGLLSIEVGERWLKRGWINLLSPNLLRNLWYYHTKFKKKPFYKLCSSAYGARDQYRLHTFKNRCYKWGYFTNVDENFELKAYDTEATSKEGIPLMWCARFLRLKHPELPVLLAAKLKKVGYRFVIDMYGDGVELDGTKVLAKQLGVDDVIRFMGAHSNEEILEAMRKHIIFLFTSDKHEGWGAVLNEAMSNGCAVVASNQIGSVPFMVRDKENGMVFKSCDIDSLYEKVTYLLDNQKACYDMALNALYTMRDIWSPKQAAINFIQLAEDLLNGNDTSIKEGPCSKALPLNY